MKKSIKILSTVIFILTIMLTAADAADNTANSIFNYTSWEESTWQTKLMLCQDKLTASNFYDSGTDFFKDEFGKSCVFIGDLLSEWGFASEAYEIKDKALVFKSGKKGFSFGFGNSPEKNYEPDVRFGAGWRRRLQDIFRLSMTIEQNVIESQWRFQIMGPGNKYILKKEFSIKGKDLQNFICDLGLVRELYSGPTGGIRFTCLTPEAEIKIKSMEIAPYSADVFFRRIINLPWKPVMAKATFDAPEDYDIFINGKKAAEGDLHYFPGTVRTIDLLPYLKKGENIIAIRKNFFSWLRNTPEILFEGFAADRDGEIIRILGSSEWKSSLQADKGWQEFSFDDQHWKPALEKKTIGISFITADKSWDDKQEYFTGVNPAHMGLLDAAPAGRKHPVFGCTDQVIDFILKTPTGIEGKMLPSLKIVKTESGAEVEKTSSASVKNSGDLTERTFSVKTREPGAYRLIWYLADTQGKISEIRKDELIIAGPVKQDYFDSINFENELSGRLEAIIKIDCAAEASAENFLDHTGMYAKPPASGTGKSVEKNGLKYRETGPGLWSYFAYKIDKTLEIGAPYLVEIVVPDDADRQVQSGVVEIFPVRMRNNSPGVAVWSSTGSCYTGGKYPLSGKMKKFRYVYFPASKTAAVIVISGYTGLPAAAAEINIFKVKGNLPALKIPPTDRMFGDFNERITVMTATTGKCENALMDTGHCRNGNVLGWYYWYKAIERKITLLRFQGYNLTSEGVFMYNNGDYPSLRNNVNIANQDLDPAYLAIKMYNHNNINCMLGVEYCSSPAYTSSEKQKISDRKMTAGEETSRAVDKFGRQVDQPHGREGNFLHPQAASVFYDTISEIYDFYKNAGTVSGLCMIVGKYYFPGFLPTIRNKDHEDTELLGIGYDDFTVSLFEKESGITLGIAKTDKNRFSRRFELLCGKYRTQWLNWRAAKIKESFDKISGIITAEGNKWKLYAVPYFHVDEENPFMNMGSSKEARGTFVEDILLKAGYPPALYTDRNINLSVRMLRRYKFNPADDSTHIEGWNENSVKLIPKSGSLFFFDKGLPGFFDEIDCPAQTANNWMWKGTTRGVFVSGGIADSWMEPFTKAVSEYIPQIIFYSLLDCNMDTRAGEEARLFLKTFYETPQINFTAINAAGIIAQKGEKDGTLFIRLVNSVPYSSGGSVSAEGEITDLTSEKIFKNKAEIRLKPYEIRLCKIKNAAGSINCSFRLDPKIENDFFSKAQILMSDKFFTLNLPPEILKSMKKHLDEKNAFSLINIMEEFEIKKAVITIKQKEQAAVNQKKFEEEIKNGSVRINCGGQEEFFSADGKRWLPDQINASPSYYGCKGASFVDRGEKLKIKNSAVQRVYQTEAYGNNMSYQFPLSNGKYNLTFHFAETSSNVKDPGGRQFTIKAGNLSPSALIDPLAAAGGWGSAYIMKIDGVMVTDGILKISFSSSAEINGMEIELQK